MTQLVSDSTLIQMLSNQLFFAHRYESEYCLNKEFKAVRRQEGISSPSSEAVVDRVFKCVKKVCSESAVKAIESKKWATLQANLEQYCKTQKDFNPDSKLYEKVSKILKQRVETTRTSKEFFEHILGKNEKELTSSDAIFLQEVATTLEYEKSFFEALFLQTNQELRLLECKKAMEAAGIIICAPANAQSSTGDITYQYEFVGSERGSLTAHLFMKRFRSFSNKKRTLLPKEQFFEVLELMQSNDKDIKQIATQFFEFSRHRYAHEMQNRHIKMAVQSVAKKAVAIRSFKEQFYAFCPYLFPLIEAVIKASLKAAKEAHEGTFDSWSIDPEYAKTKKELFECYTKGYDEAQALYQKSLHKLKGYAAVHNMKIESMLLPFQSLGKIFKEPLQSKAFMRPLEDYRTVNVPLDINLWEEEWREMRQRKIEEQIASISLTPSPVQAEEKKEEKKSPVVSASPKSSISLPFTYNAWVADWFVNPEKNLTHQKYCTSKKQQVVEAHTFAQAIDHFAKVVGIRGRYQSKNNPSKWYESYTISVEIEDMEGEKRREYITYGFHEKTGLLEHRSLTIATQEEDIAAQLEEGYDQFDWPELNAEKNKKLLKEISLKLCQKYGASDKSCLVEVSEYTLTFWDNKNQCWIQIMNPRGVDALRAMV